MTPHAIKVVLRSLGVIATCISAVASACAVSFASALLGGFFLSVVLPDTWPDTIVETLFWALFALVGFAGVFAGTVRLWECGRKLGSVILLCLGLSFYRYLWSGLACREPHPFEFPHFWPLTVGGLAAVIFFLLRRPANPQGGANGWQPLRSGEVQTSPAAASRRSP